jgi:probable HAF family extracellular repeat protein
VYLKENIMQARTYVSLFLLSLTLALGSVAKAHPAYRVKVMGPADSVATDMNAAGTVVGSYPFGPAVRHGFLNRGSGLVDLGTLGGTESEAVAINDKGVVLGHWVTAGGERRGFLYRRGVQTDIGVVPGFITTFTDINNAGYISVFGIAPETGEGQHSFLRSPGGSYLDIGALPYDNPQTLARALNNRNQITGESGPLTFPDQPHRAFVWTRGVMRDLGDLGFDINSGLDINDRGQITGYASLPLGFRTRHAFLYSKGELIDIDGRPDVDFNFSHGYGINNRGHIVGDSDHLSGFIYRGKQMVSLNTLIDPALGWDIVRPVAINDAGQIAATAVRAGVQYAVRLDPVHRHHAEAAVASEPDEVAEPAAAEAHAAASADAEAEAKEVAQPVE